MRKSNLVSETIMYSINPVRKNMKGKTKGGEVIVHHLPWSRTSPQLEKYVARGLTFERPQVEAPLYVSDKLPKPRKKRKASHKKEK